MSDNLDREHDKQRLAGLCQEMIERLDSGGTFGEMGIIAKHAARTAEMLGRLSPPAEIVTLDQEDQGFPPLVKHYHPQWRSVTMMKLHDPYVGYWEFITAVDAPDGAAGPLSTTDRAKIRKGAINVLRRWVRWCECPDAGDRTDWHDPIIDPADFLSMMKENLAAPPVEQQGGAAEPPAEADRLIGTTDAAVRWPRGEEWFRGQCARGVLTATRGDHNAWEFTVADAEALMRRLEIAPR